MPTAISDAVIGMLPTVEESAQEELGRLATDYRERRSLLRSWRLREGSPVDTEIRQATLAHLDRITTELKESAAGRLLLILLSDEAQSKDNALAIERAIDTWLEA